MYSTHAWKIDNISIQTVYHWKCLFIGFPKCSWFQDRIWGLRETCKNVSVISQKITPSSNRDVRLTSS